MADVDLSDYAGVFLLGLSCIHIVLAFFGYKMNGKESAIISGALFIPGVWVGLGIVKVMDFDDATPKTVLTLGAFSIVFSSIYITYVFMKWLKKRKLLRLQKKQSGYQNELIKLEQEIVDRNNIFHLIQLLNLCGGDTLFFEKHNKISDVSHINDEIKKKKAKLKDISAQIIWLGGD